MNLPVGSRVQVEAYNYILGEHLVDGALNPDKKRGVVVKSLEEKSFFKGLYDGLFLVQDNIFQRSIVIAMDYPVNNSSTHTKERAEITRKYNLPSIQHVVIITKEFLQLQLVRLLYLGRTKVTGDAIVRCDQCGDFQQRFKMLCGCSMGHYCCAYHLIPWDRQTQRPKFEESRAVYMAISNVIRVVSNESSQHVLDVSKPETLSMIMVHKWDSLKTESRRNEFLSAMISSGLQVICTVCKREGYSGRQCNLSLVALEKDIFRDEEDIAKYRSRMTQSIIPDDCVSLKNPAFSANNANKTLNEDVRLQLLSRGVPASVIMQLEEDNPDDIDTMDFGLALCVVESMAIFKRSNVAGAMSDFKDQYIFPSLESSPSLKAPVDVIFVSPYGSTARASHASVHLPEGIKLVDIMKLALSNIIATDNWLQSCPLSDLNLFMIKPRTFSQQKVQWREEIAATDCEQNLSQQSFSIRDQAIVELRTSKDNVGPRMLLSKMTADFRHNTSMLSKVVKLESAYSGFRRIRGDGNCYYRAVMFGLVEQIIESDRRSVFYSLHARVTEYSANYRAYISEEELVDGRPLLWESQFRRFMDIMLLAAELKAWATVDDFEAEILLEDMDDAMIRCCRRLVSAFLLTHQETHVNGITLAEAILPSHPDCESMKEYCLRYVDCMGVDAEGPFVYLGVVFIALGCYGMTVLLDRRDDVVLNFFETDPNCIACNSQTTGFCVHLLLRPGHYDLLKPVQSDRPTGKPHLGAQDLAKLYGIKSKATKSDIPSSSSLDSWDELAKSFSRLEAQLSVDYPSLAHLCEPPSADIVSLLHSIPRVVIVSRYHALKSSCGCLVLPSDHSDSTSSEAKILALQGSDAELIQIARKNFQISPHKKLALIKLDSNGSYGSEAVYEVRVSEQVRVRVDCTDVIFDRASSFAEQYIVFEDNRCLFNVILDLGMFRNLNLLIAGLAKVLRLPSDCCCGNENIWNALWDFADAQSIDLGLHFTIPLSQGKLIILCDMLRTRKQNVRLSEKSGLEELMEMAKMAMGLPSWLAVQLKSDQGLLSCADDVAALCESCVVLVDWCMQCRSGSPGPARGIDRDNTLYTVSSCQHRLCGACFEACVDAQRILRSLGESSETVRTVYMYLEVPTHENCSTAVVDNFVPQLIETIRCPIDGCGCVVSGDATEITNLPSVMQDFFRAMDDMQTYIKYLRACRTCCLFNVMFCDEFTHVDDLMQLGCNHYYHKECIAGYIKSEIDKSRTNSSNIQIACYECNNSHMTCNCEQCFGRDDRGGNMGHIYTEQEINALVQGKFLTLELKAQWDQITIEITASFLGVMFQCVECHLQFMATRYQCEEEEITCPSENCNARLCTQCKRVSHKGVTCEVFTRRLQREEMEASGFRFIQECPNCAHPWDLPIDCLHATCEGKGGCGQQFCFLCAAPYTSTTTHGNWYHRPGCSSYCDVCDCVGNPEADGAGCNQTSCISSVHAVCAKSKYWPGPCPDCLAAKTFNNCEHGTWRACNTCKNTVDGKTVQCKHWCHECRKKGSLCTPPGNPIDTTTVSGFQYKCFNREEVLAEAEKLARK